MRLPTYTAPRFCRNCPGTQTAREPKGLEALLAQPGYHNPSQIFATFDRAIEPNGPRTRPQNPPYDKLSDVEFEVSEARTVYRWN